jgi:hypothetical protein
LTAIIPWNAEHPEPGAATSWVGGAGAAVIGPDGRDLFAMAHAGVATVVVRALALADGVREEIRPITTVSGALLVVVKERPVTVTALDAEGRPLAYSDGTCTRRLTGG